MSFLSFFVIFLIFFLLKNKKLNLEIYESKILEFFWTLFPIFILICLGIPSLNLLYKSEFFSETPSISIKITGHQWYWSYDYSDFQIVEFDSFIIPFSDLKEGINRLLEVDNRVILPFNLFIRFIITSADVLHSFSVPRLGIKVDANPGRLNQICSRRLFPSIIYGQCSEICGANHSFIPIVIEFTRSLSFKNWIKSF